MILTRFVDRGRIVVYRVAHPVRGCDFDELPNSTAHDGTIVNNKDSRPGHGRENYYGAPPQNNTEMPLFRIAVFSR